MSAVQYIQGVYHRLGPAGAVAVAAGVLGVVVLGASLFSFTRAMVTTAPAVDASNNGNKNVEVYKGQFKDYLAQINGRTLFVLPGPPRAKEPEPPPPGPPPPPPKPTSYEGSAIMALVLDSVWFENGTHLKVGDPEKDDTRVVSVNAPWDAVLKWKGEEFTVPLFPRDKIVFKKDPAPAEATTPAATPAEAAKPADDAAKPATDAANKLPASDPTAKPAEPKPGVIPPATPAPSTPSTSPAPANPSPKIDS